MTSLRSDARRAMVARRERSFATPAPFAAPVVSTLVLVLAVGTALILIGTSAPFVVGALTVVVAIAAVAAHRSVASLCAGLSLLAIRPYVPGERVRLFSPERGGVVEAEIVRIGLLNTTLAIPSGLLVVANTRMLRAAPECRG